MPEELPTADIEVAEAAVHNARTVRKIHAKRTERGNSQRESDIGLALQRLKSAMIPLRSEIGRFSYGPQTETAFGNRQKIYRASQALQSERRKLWKMQKRDA